MKLSCLIQNYRIVGNFQGVQLSQMGDLLLFCSSLFVDVCDCVTICLYKRAYFTGLIFAVQQSTVKIGPLEIFPLYSIYMYLKYKKEGFVPAVKVRVVLILKTHSIQIKQYIQCIYMHVIHV